MPDIVCMFHGRPTQGQKRWVNARLSLDKAVEFHARLGEALAQVKDGEDADIDFPAVYVHGNAEICTGTVLTEQSDDQRLQPRMARQRRAR